MILEKVLNCRYIMTPSSVGYCFPAKCFFHVGGIENSQMVPNQENMEADHPVQSHSHAQQPLHKPQTCVQRRIQDFHLREGAQKIMCPHAHYERGTELLAGVQGPLKGPLTCKNIFMPNDFCWCVWVFTSQNHYLLDSNVYHIIIIIFSCIFLRSAKPRLLKIHQIIFCLLWCHKRQK